MLSKLENQFNEVFGKTKEQRFEEMRLQINEIVSTLQCQRVSVFISSTPESVFIVEKTDDEKISHHFIRGFREDLAPMENFIKHLRGLVREQAA